MDILKNTDAMGKRIFADLEKINFIRTSTSAEETRAANIIKDELAKEGLIQVGRGRGGSKITEKGLNKLKIN